MLALSPLREEHVAECIGRFSWAATKVVPGHTQGCEVLLAKGIVLAVLGVAARHLARLGSGTPWREGLPLIRANPRVALEARCRP